VRPPSRQCHPLNGRDMGVNDCFEATLLQANGSVLVAARGEIDINTAGAFAAALSEAAGWSRRLFVDLQDVDFIGVAGLRALQLELRDMNHRFGAGEITILSPPKSLTLIASVVELPTGLTISTAACEKPPHASLLESVAGSTGPLPA